MSLDAAFPITAAQLVGNWCETLFYGIYLVTCAFAVRTLFLKGRGRDERWLRLDEIRWLMVFFALAFFGILTFDVAIGLQHNYIAFIQTDGPDGPLKEFLNLGEWINVARSATQCISMLLADFVLIYRCYVVYGRRWVTITPSTVIFLANIAVSIRVIQLEVEPATTKDTSLDNSAELSAWVIAVFALGTAQNVLSTGLLIFRIWRVDHDLEKYIASNNTMEKRQPRHLRKVLIMLAESGAFYTITVLLCLILVLIKSDAFYATGDINLQSTGIVFNVILVRASTIRDRQFTTYHGDQSTFHAAARPDLITINTDTHAEIEGSLTAAGNGSEFKRSGTNIYSSDASMASRIVEKS